jgi:cytochrome bd-type quinol oxidase subunit 2
VKREVPILITLVTGVFCLIGFFVPHPWVHELYSDMQTWAIVVVGCTYVLGVANLLRINTRHIQRRERDWPFKVVLVVGMLATMTVGFSEGTGYSNVSSRFQWIYRTFYSPMAATMFALLAFFIASAAFRAFRIRSTEAMLLAIAAFILMLGRVPLGGAIHPFLPEAADWLMEIPQNAAKRGILIGAALGVMATGIRLILGLEKTYGGGEGNA